MSFFMRMFFLLLEKLVRNIRIAHLKIGTTNPIVVIKAYNITNSQANIDVFEDTHGQSQDGVEFENLGAIVPSLDMSAIDLGYNINNECIILFLIWV